MPEDSYSGKRQDTDLRLLGGSAMLPKLPDFSLSLEQQFDLRKYQQLVKNIPRHELENLLIQAIRLKMAQENLAKGVIKHCLMKEAPSFSGP
ncbi:MAG: phycobilisome degradation protein NblA [Xenococcaceae cyanobacterium]